MLRGKLHNLYVLLQNREYKRIAIIVRGYIAVFFREFSVLLFGVYFSLLNKVKPTRIMLCPMANQGNCTINFISFMTKVFSKEMLDGRVKVICLFVHQGLSDEKLKELSNSFLMDKIKSICLSTIKDCKIMDQRKKPLLTWMYYRMFLKQDRAIINTTYTIDRFEPLENNSILPISFFTDEEKTRGDSILKKMCKGYGDNDWFVCIFARDNAYYRLRNDVEQNINGLHEFRNSDIETYNLAIKYIIEKGGWVIRLGKNMEHKLQFQHPRVIDYPFSEYSSGFMDFYLQYKAKFVLSSLSGATDVVVLFGTPFCCVNADLQILSPYKNSINIPKKFSLNGKMVGLRQFASFANAYQTQHTTFYCSEFLEDMRLVQINNTPQEILDITKEMFERLEGRFEANQEDKQLQKKCCEIYKEMRYRPYRDKSLPTMELVYTPLGKQFLRDNAQWYLAD